MSNVEPDEPYPPGTPIAEEKEPFAMIPDPADQAMNDPEREPSAPVDPLSYGPVRRRVAGKSVSASMFRPGRMQVDDCSELMNEIVPQLVEDTLQEVASPADPSMSTPMDSEVISDGQASGRKRDASEAMFPEEATSKSARTHEKMFAACETCVEDEVEVTNSSIAMSPRCVKKNVATCGISFTKVFRWRY